MTDIRFRPATHNDVAFLNRCAEAAYQQYVAAIGQKPAPMIYDFENKIGIETIDLIEWNKKRAGYLVWRVTPSALFLDSIALTPIMKGKGLARAAFDYLENEALQNKKPSIELYTNINMSENLTLYPHLGFVETDRRTEDGFERVYFQKSLI